MFYVLLRQGIDRRGNIKGCNLQQQICREHSAGHDKIEAGQIQGFAGVSPTLKLQLFTGEHATYEQKNDPATQHGPSNLT